MIKGWRVMVFLFIGVCINTCASAGLIQDCLQDESISYSQNDLQSNIPLISDDLLAPRPDLWPAQSIPIAPENTRQDHQRQEQQYLTDGTSSLSLCLSALIGFGLFGSTHWVKRMHLGLIPQWYHDGGPFQIGHSRAIMPNCLCSAADYCFIQPILLEGDFSLLLFRQRKVIISLWRQSQFTPDVIASRGPPYIL